MRHFANIVSCFTAIALVSTDSAIAEVIGLALLFMAAFNIGHKEASDK